MEGDREKISVPIPKSLVPKLEEYRARRKAEGVELEDNGAAIDELIERARPMIEARIKEINDEKAQAKKE